MAKTGNTGIKRIVYAGKYSMQGYRKKWKNEAAFRQELMATFVLTLLAVFLPDLPLLDRFLLAVFPWLVMTVEILNSAIEAVVDRFGDEWNELSGRAKDIGSAAVFTMLMVTLATWIVILIKNYC